MNTEITEQWKASWVRYNAYAVHVSYTQYLALALGVAHDLDSNKIEDAYLLGAGLRTIMEASAFPSSLKEELTTIIRNLYNGLTEQTMEKRMEQCIVEFCSLTMFKDIPPPPDVDILTYRIVRRIATVTRDKVVIRREVDDLVKPYFRRKMVRKVRKSMRDIEALRKENNNV